MKLKLAVVFAALASVGFLAAPSPSHAQFKDLKEKAKKAAAAKKQGKAKDTRSSFQKRLAKKAEQKAEPKK